MIRARDARAGGIVATATLLNVVAYAAFLANGPIASLLPTILVAALVSTAVVSLVLARTYSLPSAMGGPAGNAAAVAGAALATVVAHDAASARGADVAVVLALTALLPGLVMLALGMARVGRAVRYLPYPVVAGFLAGTGWLLLVGAVRLAGGPASLALAALLTLVLRYAVARSRWPGTFAATATAAIVATWVVLAALRVPPDVARAHGWLFARPEATSRAAPIFASLGHADWHAIGGAWSALVWVVIVVVIVSTLNGALLEAASERDEAVDRDLVVLGGANVLAACFGGFGSQMVLPTSLAAHALAPRSRAPGYVVAVVASIAAASCARVLPYLPAFVFAAILAFHGLRFLEQYVRDASRTMARGDTAIAIVMLVATASLGLENALFIGLLLACGAFIGAAGRFPVVRRVTSLRDARSRVERSPNERAELDACGERVALVRLQGHLFFGSASVIDAKLRPLVDRESAPVALVLDFTLVEGVDVSAALGFAKLARRAGRRGVALAFAGASDAALRELRGSGAFGEADVAFATLDEALESFEERLLERRGRTGDVPSDTMSLTALLAPFVETIELAAGDALFAAGDPSDALYVLVAGRLTVRGDGVRLRTLVAETLVGEMGFYTGIPRGADVCAVGDARAYRLSRDAYARLEREEPAVVRHVVREIVRVQADRLRASNAEMIQTATPPSHAT